MSESHSLFGAVSSELLGCHVLVIAMLYDRPGSHQNLLQIPCRPLNLSFSLESGKCLYVYFCMYVYVQYLQSVCFCRNSLIRRCEAVNDTGWGKLSSGWVGDRTHVHHYAPFSCYLPLCGVTSRSSVFCDKFGQIAIISFLSSASIWCLSAPPGSRPRPKVHQTFAHTDSTHPYIYIQTPNMY